MCRNRTVTPRMAMQTTCTCAPERSCSGLVRDAMGLDPAGSKRLRVGCTIIGGQDQPTPPPGRTLSTAMAANGTARSKRPLSHGSRAQGMTQRSLLSLGRDEGRVADQEIGLIRDGEAVCHADVGSGDGHAPQRQRRGRAPPPGCEGCCVSARATKKVPVPAAGSVAWWGSERSPVGRDSPPHEPWSQAVRRLSADGRCDQSEEALGR